ncbi:MAG: hypothetical protein RL660_587 [Bacteroidota bacterium]|jgi:hypothetical protein
MVKFCLSALLICSAFIQCAPESKQSTNANKIAIAALLDTLNATAARAHYDAYFACYADSATFLGTDATEHWYKDSFMRWAKPFFDKKKAWSFKSVQRHIYFGKAQDIAWFDELLSTQMKLCRGSGVVVKQGNTWKIAQYVLSMTVPNDVTKVVVNAKGGIEDSLLLKLAN